MKNHKNIQLPNSNLPTRKWVFMIFKCALDGEVDEVYVNIKSLEVKSSKDDISVPLDCLIFITNTLRKNYS